MFTQWNTTAQNNFWNLQNIDESQKNYVERAGWKCEYCMKPFIYVTNRQNNFLMRTLLRKEIKPETGVNQNFLSYRL
jgi:hypothetical protein